MCPLFAAGGPSRQTITSPVESAPLPSQRTTDAMGRPYESKRLGWGGRTLVSLITGLSRWTIWRGQRELDAELQGRHSDRARVPGGVRHPQLTEDQLRLLRDLLSQGATAHGWQKQPVDGETCARADSKTAGGGPVH
jgi:hypothetical protein